MKSIISIFCIGLFFSSTSIFARNTRTEFNTWANPQALEDGYMIPTSGLLYPNKNNYPVECRAINELFNLFENTTVKVVSDCLYLEPLLEKKGEYRIWAEIYIPESVMAVFDKDEVFVESFKTDAYANCKLINNHFLDGNGIHQLGGNLFIQFFNIYCHEVSGEDAVRLEYKIFTSDPNRIRRMAE